MYRLILIYVILLGVLPAKAQFKTYDQSISLIQDNDILKFVNRTDHYYSFGMFLNYEHSLHSKSGILKIVPFKKSNDRFLWGGSLSIEAFTPREKGDSASADRPFSGILTGRFSITQANQERLLKWQIETGFRGPIAHAGDFQNWLHELIGSSRVNGWENQLENQFLLNGYATYAKPFPIFTWLEFIPQTDLALGNNNTYLQQGLTFRWGLFNPLHESSYMGMDVGLDKTNKIREIFFTSTIYGRIALVNSTLSKENVSQEELLSINKNNFLAGVELKIHLLFNRFGGSFAYHKISPNTDITLSHSYGSIGLSYRW